MRPGENRRIGAAEFLVKLRKQPVFHGGLDPAPEALGITVGNKSIPVIQIDGGVAVARADDRKDPAAHGVLHRVVLLEILRLAGGSGGVLHGFGNFRRKEQTRGDSVHFVERHFQLLDSSVTDSLKQKAALPQRTVAVKLSQYHAGNRRNERQKQGKADGNFCV